METAVIISPRLTLDTMEIDTELAKKYIKINKKYSCFGPHVKVKPDISIHDSYGNEILILDQDSISKVYNDIHNSDVVLENRGEAFEKMRSLAKELEKNIELLAQIEYLVRKIPIDSSRKQLQFVVQHLFNAAADQMVMINAENCVKMHNKPLLHLGLVANSLTMFDAVVIESTVDTAVVCHLVTSLCHKAGFKVNFLVEDDTATFGKETHDMKENHGCIGIVTEKSDIDSAIDTFIESGTRAPWSLQQIYVEECIYKQFTEAMKSKTCLNGVENVPDKKEFHSTPRDIFACKDKVFLLDYSGTDQVLTHFNRNIIQIEAYRTTKELLSLIKLHMHIFISLWSSDISVAHEIAYAVDAPVVWINDFAVVEGPIRATEAIYSEIQLQYFKSNFEIELNVSKGLDKIFKECSRALEKERLDAYSEIQSVIRYQGFVEVENGRMCVGTSRPTALIFRKTNSDIYVNTISELEFNCFTSQITSYVDILPHDIDWQQFKLAVYTKLKTVWSNFGTIFAN